MTKHLLPTILITLFFSSLQAQTGKWTLQLGIGAATETNLGDSGIRTFGKVSYALKHHLNVHFGMGSFQMLHSNEQWEPLYVYHEMRSLSFYHWDLGLGAGIINKHRFNLGVNAGATFRLGRQLYAEKGEYLNSVLRTYYVHDKIHEIGYKVDLETSFKVNEKWWLGINLNCHNYNYFGEYFGAGVFATINL